MSVATSDTPSHRPPERRERCADVRAGTSRVSSLSAEIDRLSIRWDPRLHPFVRAWSTGTLPQADLQVYTSEYYHGVVALARVSERIARLADGVVAQGLVVGRASAKQVLTDALSDHLRARRCEIELWEQVARGSGWCHSSAWLFAEDPLPSTVACIRVWTGDRSRTLGEHVTTLMTVAAIEARVSQLMRDRPALDRAALATTEYFNARAQRRLSDARLFERVLLTQLGHTDHTDPLARHAEEVLRGYWNTCDGISSGVWRAPGGDAHDVRSDASRDSQSPRSVLPGRGQAS